MSETAVLTPRACPRRLSSTGRGGVLGNHEDWLLRWLGGGPLNPLDLVGGMEGESTLRSWGLTSDNLFELSEQRGRVPRVQVEWLRGGHERRPGTQVSA